ncbi:hypothetical protein LTR95_014676 [Oleoguttula sp. CCFEE 5521]
MATVMDGTEESTGKKAKQVSKCTETKGVLGKRSGMQIWQPEAGRQVQVFTKLMLSSARAFVAQNVTDDVKDTKERPYSCRLCSRSFPRADVRATHEKTCIPPQQEGTRREIVVQRLSRKRVRIACATCRKRKVACDGRTPCGPCQSSLGECRYEGGSDGTQTLDNAPTARHPGDTTNAPPGADNTEDEQIVTHFPGLEGIDLLFQSSDAAPQNDMDLPPFHTELTQANDIFDFSHLWTPLPDAQFFFDDTELFDPRFFALDSTERSEMSSPTLRFTTSMQGYFDAKSRPSSPSRDRGAKMWYSKPADLASHNPDILKIFIGLFGRHISQTFAIFTDDADRPTKHSSSYILAMGAVGGLYSIVPGSGDFAQAMHNDARRLSLAEAIAVYDSTCNTESNSHEDATAAQLLAAMYILDCYRVVIMMRPPSLMWRRMSHITRRAAEVSELGLLKRAVRQLTDGVFRTPADVTHEIASLAAMAPLLWSAVPRITQYDAGDLPLREPPLTRSVLIDVAFEKWYQLRDTSFTDITALILYHVMQIVLHTDLTTLQAFIYADADSSRRTGRQEIASKALHLWMKSRDYDTAQWHAGQIMDLVESAIPYFKAAESRTNAHAAPANSRSLDKRILHEVAHVPYAIYYATIVLYVKDGAVAHKASASAVRAPILRGERLLSLLRIDVAQPLARVLCDIA